MNHQTRVYDDILELLPDVDHPTPLVRIRRLAPVTGFELHAKLEWMNPFGSVKDRAAAYLLRDLVRQGKLVPGRSAVEATSGNTGLSMAGIAAALGVGMRAVVPNRVPLEKKVLLRIAGAELDVINDAVCPSPGMGEGSINLARTRARAEPDRYVMPNQYENELNARAHYETTGPEIWRQTAGRVTHLFVTLGTCGTAMGCGRFLKERNPRVKLIALQPSEGHDVPGLRNVSELGVSRLFDPAMIDELIEIDFELAYTRALELARGEGLMAGPSAGLVFEGACRVAERGGAGVGVMIFPDNAFKYISSFVKHLPQLAEGTTADRREHASRTTE
ncbi:MAG: cysteine synthase family protein [Candidatus Eisenbacteria bacterium]|uniref:Cysteine synthase family protein n=1 Tax=Eiseniibacteriota bacterium TaxID=2212470 RepID=A0A849SMI0_UNCEI|nr:cysteine synthase family protein [Candidatus Eisenbacteria bacterium]